MSSGSAGDQEASSYCHQFPVQHAQNPNSISFGECYLLCGKTFNGKFHYGFLKMMLQGCVRFSVLGLGGGGERGKLREWARMSFSPITNAPYPCQGAACSGGLFIFPVLNGLCIPFSSISRGEKSDLSPATSPLSAFPP